VVTNYCVVNAKDVKEVKDVERAILVIPVLTHLADASITIAHVLL
jgi:hypothetical protein